MRRWIPFEWSREEQDEQSENAKDRSLRSAAWLITTATFIKVAGFYYASVEHVGEPTWSAHAQFHHVLGIIWLTGLGVASLTLAWGPMQRGEKWSLSLLLSTFTFAHIGFFITQLIVPAGRPPVLPFESAREKLIWRRQDAYS